MGIPNTKARRNDPDYGDWLYERKRDAELDKRHDQEQWACYVYDRDGGLICGCEDETFETVDEAWRFGVSCEDDPRYGSHEVEKL